MNDKPKFHIKRRTVIVIAVIFVLLIIALSYDLVRYHNRTTLPNSHVFICDDSEHYSDFDNWLFDAVGVDRVPIYVVIYNNSVIGLVDGNVPENHFTDALGTVLATGENLFELPNIEIHNILNETYTLQEIAKQHSLILLEISWATCEDCIEQDKYFTKDIYNTYGTEQIYRYYIKSELSDVLAKHHK